MNKNAKRTPRKQQERGLIDPRSVKEYKVYVETTLMDFLLFKMSDSPRKTVKSLLSNHQVSVNGVPTSQFDFPLYPEDTVLVSKNKMAKRTTKDLPIIYEDDDLVVINKPSGLLSVDTDREKGRTAYRLLSDYVRAKNPKSRLFVVHRLDKNTSGVLVFAKSYEVREALQNAWQDVVKYRGYYAIIEGEMEKPEGRLQNYLAQNDLQLVYVTRDKEKGKLAITNYKTISTKDGYSLLDINIESGRKNQIRVQLGHTGHYVIGDDKYGEPADPIKRLGLHAYRLTFTNPINKKAYDFKTEMPLEFKKMFFESRAAQRKADEESKVAKRNVSRDTRSATKIKKGQMRRQKGRYGKA
ncbi:MAG: RluA family pseudouridine synthase [Bacilli bacterium]|nr:RluA family pseudouridine synthase [Bacilli bacterium]